MGTGRLHKLTLLQLLQEAMTKYHNLGGLKNRNYFLTKSGEKRSKIKVLAGFFSEATLLGLQMTVFLPGSPYGLSSVSVS